MARPIGSPRARAARAAAARWPRRLVGVGRGGARRAPLVAGDVGRGAGGAADLAGHPAEPARGGPQLPEPADASARSLQSIAATLQRVLIGFGLAVARRRAARHPRRLVARGRGRRRAAGALRPQPPGRGADPADHPVVRHRRDAEGDVHLHRLRAVRLLRRGRGDRRRARPLRRDGADARRDAAADRAQGAGRRWRCPTSTTACGTCSAWRSATSCWPS